MPSVPFHRTYLFSKYLFAYAVDEVPKDFTNVLSYEQEVSSLHSSVQSIIRSLTAVKATQAMRRERSGVRVVGMSFSRTENASTTYQAVASMGLDHTVRANFSSR